MPADRTLATALIAAKVTPSLKARVTALAADRGLTVSRLIVALLERELENEL